MTEFKNITAILTELDSLAAKADRFTAQRKANAATDDERAALGSREALKCH